MTIREQDIFDFECMFPLKSQLQNASILITGSTGLIGSTLVECLYALHGDIHITLPVRNAEKARKLFGSKSDKFNIIQCDLLDFLHTMKGRFDYIIHCASPTNGKYMVEHPVETYTLAINTTKYILDYCRNNSVKSFVYVSSLEYYGEIHDDRIITEEMIGYVDHCNPRSCYPLGKRSAEFLCTAYAKEYNISVKIARLTQTFGAGVAIDDNRVFAQFARSIIAGADIILHTQGKSAKPYCYTTDCVSAILYILLKGEQGEAYNVANESTYITIADMAYFLKENFNPNVSVRIEEHPEMGYAAETKLHLSTRKLMLLGWKPQYGLKEMYDRFIKSIV